jgi:predicted dehydrogenase
METQENRIISIAVIGAGLIGKERLKAINLLKEKGRNIKISGIYDPYCKNKAEIIKEFKVPFYKTIDDLYDNQPDWIFIAVPHDAAVPLIENALLRDFNVLVEKPLGRSLKEAEIIAGYVKRSDQLWVGFNYRFFDGITLALKDIKEGVFGKIISINMILGHGSDPEMKNSWKLDPIKAGGGCLIDPGIHFLDLIRIISDSNLDLKYFWKWQGFWNTGIEEECHILFEGKKEFLINLQISIVRWRSTFRIEINGEDGYGIITGRNRSYGNQKYIRGKRWGWLNGVNQRESEFVVIESNGEDVFAKEIDALLFSDDDTLLKPCSYKEAIENMRLLDLCLKAS